MKSMATFLIGCVLLSTSATAQKNSKPELQDGKQRHGQPMTALADEVRHQLLTLPYYGVFDWLEANVQPDDSVVLRGEVVRDSTKKDAESRVRKLEGVPNVTNQIEILPGLPNDQQIRRQVYSAIFKFDSPLFQYATLAVPPIHIIVSGGHVTLKGIVNSDMDKQLAFMAASAVPGVFDVKNELVVQA